MLSLALPEMFSQRLLLRCFAITRMTNCSFVSDPQNRCCCTNTLSASSIRSGDDSSSCCRSSTVPEDNDDVTGRVDKHMNSLFATSMAIKVPSKIKKRTYAILFGYIGACYNGIQFHDHSPTIEKELASAFCKAGLVQECSKTALWTLFYKRTSRTDKRVSAVQQLASIHCRIESTDLAELKQMLNENLPDDIRVFGRFYCCSRTYTYTLPSFAFARVDEQTDSTFRLTEERRAEVNSVLAAFVGTHNFFNFTVKSPDRTTWRTVKSFSLLSNTLVHNDVEFAIIEVTGASFIMYQIRMMVGLTMAIIRGVLSHDLLDCMFGSSILHVPKAPGLGLALDSLCFDGYNKCYSKSHDQLSWDNSTQAELQQFKEKILSTIFETELKDNLMMEWLNSYLLTFKNDFLTDTEFQPASIFEHSVSSDKGEEDTLIMYSVLRRDLLERSVRWSVGALVGQAAHASAAAIWTFKDDPYVTEFMENCDNMLYKVVLVSSEEQLLELSKTLDYAGVTHKLCFQQAANIPSCIAVKPQPNSCIQQYFKDFESF